MKKNYNIKKLKEERKLEQMKNKLDSSRKVGPVKKQVKKDGSSFGNVESEKELGIEKLEKGSETHFSIREKKGFFEKLFGGRLRKKTKKEEELEFISKDERRFDILGFRIQMKKRTLMIVILNSILVGSILVINFLMLKSATTLYSTINLLSLFIFAFPLILIRYSEYKKKQELEEMFPVFLRDFVESTRGGMTLPQAMKSLTRNDYKSMNVHVKVMAAQLDWGIPVERVLMGFGKKTKSRLIMRIISSVIESHRFGGNLADTFEALTNTAVEIDRLREERRLYMNSQMITGYIIFFVFLAVMIGLEKFLVPSLAEVSSEGIFGEGASQTSNADLAVEYETVFRNLILIQGLFAGLAVGKMSEGSMVAGMKHSIFMMFVGFLVFTIAA